MRDDLGPPGHLTTTLAMWVLVSTAVLTVAVVAPAAYVGLLIAIGYGASTTSSLVCGNIIRKLSAIRVSRPYLLLTAVGSA